MSIPVLQPLDLNLLELLNATAQNLATAPSHKAGRFYYDTVLGQFGMSNGTSWTYLIPPNSFNTEAAQDATAAMMVGASAEIIATYDDVNNLLVLTVANAAITDPMIVSLDANKIVESTTRKVLTDLERTKLTGIAAGATANSTDLALLARANHTGTQLASTVSDFSGAADARVAAGITGKANLASPTFTGTVGGITKAMVGLSNVDNTTDAAKPVSTAQAAADALKAPLASPTFTGTVGGVTKAMVGLASVDNTTDAGKPVSTAQAAAISSGDTAAKARANHTGTQIASTISDFTAAVNALIANTVDAAPAALDTLNELAAALGDDPNFAASMTTALGLKANTSSLAAVATSGQYSALLGKPSYTTTIGNGTATDFVVTHGLGTRAVSVDVAQNAAPYASVMVEVEKTSTTTITVKFAVAPSAAQYAVTVQA